MAGVDVLPWLGNIKHLAPTEDFAVPPYGDDNNKTPFPVRPLERRSYAQNCVVWIKPTGLQVRVTDVYISVHFNQCRVIVVCTLVYSWFSVMPEGTLDASRFCPDMYIHY